MSGQDELLIALRDGFGGEGSGGGDGVFRFAAGAATVGEELGGVFAAELFAAGAARGLEAKVGIAQRGAENGLEHGAARGESAIAVEWFVEELLG